MPSREVPLSLLHERVNGWYAEAGRQHLPWREPDASPWGVFLSEVMSQQTPLARVERHGGEVPATPEDLLALPGVGAYTAAAVSCFAFGIPEVVVDTNVRRVLARTREGKAFPNLTLNRAEAQLAADSMPAEPATANTWNVAVMELGALVCVARGPRCAECPVADLCAWNLAGRPAYDGPPRRGQSWHGTDRQVRGELLRRLRAAHRQRLPRTDRTSMAMTTRSGLGRGSR